MSIRSKRALLGAAASLVCTAAPAAAQLGPVNPFSFGVSGGAVVPVGDFGDGAKTGFGVNGLIGIRVPASPVSFRGEVGYTRNDVKDFDGNVRTISGVANVLLSASPGPTVVARPYLIGGVGVYNLKGTITFDDDIILDDASPRLNAVGGAPIRQPAARRVLRQQTASDSETKFGLNGGVGVELPLSGISAFGEVRFVSVFTEGSHLNYIPITVGIRF